jgi:hypothetical protein
MPLQGVYFSPDLGARFDIQEADVATGEAKGVILIADVEINVNIHFHFENGVGPTTDLWFAGNNDDPNEYIGGAGMATTQDFLVLKLAGAYPTQSDVLTFEGEFHRLPEEEKE